MVLRGRQSGCPLLVLVVCNWVRLPDDRKAVESYLANDVAGNSSLLTAAGNRIETSLVCVSVRSANAI
jgi:hypothetical protein